VLTVLGTTSEAEAETFTLLKNKILALREELKSTKERTAKDSDITEILFQDVNILTDRLTRAENSIQTHNRKYSGVI